MKPLLITLSLLYSFNIYSQGGWTAKSNYNAAGNLQAVGFSIGSKGYIATGRDGAEGKSTWEYDPAKDTWTQKADFAGLGREEAVAFTINEVGYVGAGVNGISHYLNDFWAYNPKKNRWTRIANFGGFGRLGAVAFAINGKGYVGSGANGTGRSFYDNLTDFWEYNPTIDSWTKVTNFPGTKGREMVAFVIGDKAYMGTGGNESVYFDEFWEYAPKSNSWSKKSNYPEGKIASAIGFSVRGKGYVGTGVDKSGNYKNTFWAYDPTTDTWTKAASYGGQPVRESVSFVINNLAYVGTGLSQDGSHRSDFWAFYKQNPVISIKEKKTQEAEVQVFSPNQILIYPNPNAQGVFTVKSSNLSIRNLRIYTLKGKRIRNFRLSSISSTKMSVNVQNLTLGTYLLHIYTTRGIVYKKILIDY